MCEYAGTYEGYKFLYSEMSAAVTTDEVDPQNLSSSFNWDSFFLSEVRTVADYVSSGYTAAFPIITDLIANLIDSSIDPVSVTFANAPDSIIRTWVQGVLYSRDIYIQDKLDRASGYAYYPWGATQQVQLYHGMRAVIPVAQRTSTSYDYESYVGQGDVQINSTLCFRPGSTLYKNVLKCYKDLTGYYEYIETINVHSMITSLIIQEV